MTGNKFVNDAGQTLVTETPKSQVDGLAKLYGASDLKGLDKLDFFVALPDGNSEISLTVDKVVRSLDAGTMSIYGSSGVDKFTTNGKQAWYKDGKDCATGTGCDVLFNNGDVKKASASRKLLSGRGAPEKDGRKLWGWGKKVVNAVVAVFSSETVETQTTPPVPEPDTHDYPDSTFAIKKMENKDIIDGMAKSPDTHPTALKGVWWLDQHGAFTQRMTSGKFVGKPFPAATSVDAQHYNSDVLAVAAADGAITFGKSKHYVLPEAEEWTVGGEKYVAV